MKEAVIVLGRRGGIRGRELAAALGLDPSAVTRRMEAARSRGKEKCRNVPEAGLSFFVFRFSPILSGSPYSR